MQQGFYCSFLWLQCSFLAKSTGHWLIGYSWNPFVGTGLTYKLITRKSDKIDYQLAIGFALATGLFLIWVTRAVGIIGSEDNPANLQYFGVIAVGLIGAFIARFQPNGMAITMFAMGLAQALVATITLAGSYFQTPPSTVFQIIAINVFFMTLFIVSTLVFRYAVRVTGNLDTNNK